jgi:hypothetical protein
MFLISHWHLLPVSVPSYITNVPKLHQPFPGKARLPMKQIKLDVSDTTLAFTTRECTFIYQVEYPKPYEPFPGKARPLTKQV